MPNNDGYTVSEVASCVGAVTPRQQDLWLRRLRHWTTMGVLETLSGQHVGTGRERRYGVEAVYLAAVLLGLGDLALPIGVLKTIASAIEADLSKHGDSAELWEEAKRPPKVIGAGCVWVGLAVKIDDESAQEAVEVGIRIAKGESLMTPEFYLEQNDTIIIRNLTQIFGRVKL